MKRGSLLLLFTMILTSCSAEPTWRSRFDDDSAWLLAVATLSQKVIAVGGQAGTAGKPGRGVIRIASDDDSPVIRLDSPQPGLLWWAHALPEAGKSAWLCGENGSVLRYGDGDPAPLRAISTNTSATLYGIWAFDDDDVWAVGGSEGGPGVVLHGGQSGFSIDASVPTVPTLFKIFATDRQHLFAVGESGTLLRRVQNSWQLDPSPFLDRLLTVFGTRESDVYAVGGLGAGRLLHFDGASWSQDAAVADFDALAGLHVTESELLIVGQRGLIATRQSSASAGPFSIAMPGTTLDLHGALIRGSARYAVGGNLSQFGLQAPRGVLLQQGSP